MQQNGRNTLCCMCTGGKLSSYWDEKRCCRPVHPSAASLARQSCCCNRSVSRKSAEITEQSSKLCGRAEAELVEQRPFQLPFSDSSKAVW